MSDILVRLRDPRSRWVALSEPDPLRLEAADEIERLRAALQAIEHETGMTMLATNHGRRGDKANAIARAALEPKP